MDGDVEVVFQAAATGSHLATLRFHSTDTVSSMRRGLSSVEGLGGDSSVVSLILEAQVLEESLTLLDAGVRSGSVIQVARQMQEVHVWQLSAWDEGYSQRGDLKSIQVLVPRMTAEALLQEVSGGTGQLLDVGLEHIRVYAPEDRISSDQEDWLQVAGAGLQTVNGAYLRDGMHLGFPRWRRHGSVIPSRGMESTWLRRGSDGNFCIVNNSDGNSSDKKFYYVSRSDTVSAGAWQEDQHGSSPPPTVSMQVARPSRGFYLPGGSRGLEATPREGLFRQMLEQGHALVVVPDIPPAHRPVALHVQSFANETLFFAKTGLVCEDSFRGLDDEQISIYDGNNESGPSVWQYLGK